MDVLTTRPTNKRLVCHFKRNMNFRNFSSFIQGWTYLTFVLFSSALLNNQRGVVSAFIGSPVIATPKSSFSWTAAVSTTTTATTTTTRTFPRQFLQYRQDHLRAVSLDTTELTPIDEEVATTRTMNDPIDVRRFKEEETQNIASDTVTVQTVEKVPTNTSDAIQVFFFSGDFGPLYVVLSILSMSIWRIYYSIPMELSDIVAFGSAIVFWWIQEHVIHQRLLHSKFHWMGKEIHEGHHAKPYYHISIDSAPLLLTWLTSAHILLRCMLPSLPLAISATLGYALAGLFYEWAHYIVHTKVPLSGSAFWTRVKSNHIRHHCVNHDFWFGFSLPLVDDLFRTNPSLKEARRLAKKVSS